MSHRVHPNGVTVTGAKPDPFNTAIDNSVGGSLQGIIETGEQLPNPVNTVRQLAGIPTDSQIYRDMVQKYGVANTDSTAYEAGRWFGPMLLPMPGAFGVKVADRTAADLADKAAAKLADDAANTARLESRVAEVHGALDPIAQTKRTTAALGTQEGTDVIGGGVRDLSPAQRELIQGGEMMAGGPGHAEVTTVLGARGAGLTPQEIVTA